MKLIQSHLDKGSLEPAILRFLILIFRWSVLFQKLPAIAPDHSIEFSRWRSFPRDLQSLSFAERSGCDRDTTLRTVDIFFSDWTSTPRTNSAISIFRSVQVDAKQNIVRIFGSGFWSGFRTWSGWRCSLGLTSGTENSAATLFALYGFTGGLIRHIQDRLTTFTSYLDRHIQSRPARFAVWGHLSSTTSQPRR